MHAIKKGLLWQHRDRMFSRWKERYFILTRDYLHCFKRASGSGCGKISEMGQFIFKVKSYFVLVHRHSAVWFVAGFYLCHLLEPRQKRTIEMQASTAT
jgi:hypothetical protein